MLTCSQRVSDPASRAERSTESSAWLLFVIRANVKACTQKGQHLSLRAKGNSESMKHAWLPCPRPHPGTRWHLAVGSRPRTSEIQFQSAEQPMLQETSLLQAAHCRLPALWKVDEPVPPEALCLPGLCCAAMTRDKRSIGMPSWLQKCLVCPLKASTACKQRSERSERLLRGRIG